MQSFQKSKTCWAKSIFVLLGSRIWKYLLFDILIKTFAGTFTTAHRDFDMGSQCRMMCFKSGQPLFDSAFVFTSFKTCLCPQHLPLGCFSCTSGGFRALDFFSGFPNLSKLGLTVSGAPSWGPTCWRETQVFIHLDTAHCVCYLSRQGRRNGFHEIQKWINFFCFLAFVSVRSATIHLSLHVTRSLEILFSGKVKCSYIWPPSAFVML